MSDPQGTLTAGGGLSMSGTRLSCGSDGARLGRAALAQSRCQAFRDGDLSSQSVSSK